MTSGLRLSDFTTLLATFSSLHFLKHGYWNIYLYIILFLIKTACEYVGARDEEHYEKRAYIQAMTVHQQKVISAEILPY